MKLFQVWKHQPPINGGFLFSRDKFLAHMSTIIATIALWQNMTIVGTYDDMCHYQFRGFPFMLKAKDF